MTGTEGQRERERDRGREGERERERDLHQSEICRAVCTTNNVYGDVRCSTEEREGDREGTVKRAERDKL